MRLNWGTTVTLVFIVFAGSISYMVYRCAIVPVDLVTAEYYKDELVYQQVIDGTKNADALSTKATMQKEGADLVLQLPLEMKNEQVTGSVLFYCPYKSGYDKKISLQTGDARQVIQRNLLEPGSYMVKINWQAGKTHYYHEQAFKI